MVFERLFYIRIHNYLVSTQHPEQAGFKSKYQQLTGSLNIRMDFRLFMLSLRWSFFGGLGITLGSSLRIFCRDLSLVVALYTNMEITLKIGGISEFFPVNSTDC